MPRQRTDRACITKISQRRCPDLEIVTANGDLVHFSNVSHTGLFDGAVISLGCLGVIVSLDLALLPTFQVAQTVYENLPLKNLVDHFDEIMSSAYSVSLFTDWQRDSINQVWIKQRQPDGVSTQRIAPLPDFFGATPATRPMHPIGGFPAETCTQQLGVPGPWQDRLPHFRIGTTPSAGNELQSEYFVPREQAVDALHAVARLRDQFAPHLLVSEIRCIAADNFWISPAYQRNSVGFHFTWEPDWAAVNALLPYLEAQLAPFNPRPHWAKVFTMPPQQIQACYERLGDFQGWLLERYDSHGKFRNAYMDNLLLT